MTQGFFDSKAGDPASLIRMFYAQTADGIPAADASLIPYKSMGGKWTPSPKRIRRAAVLTRPMRDVDIRSKVEMVGGALNLGDLDPGNHMQLASLLSFHQGYAVATADGHSRWRISQRQAEDGTQTLAKYTHINDSDKGIPFRNTDCICSGVSLAILPGQNALFRANWLAGRHDFWGAPAVTGTGLVAPKLRGTTSDAAAGFTGNWAADATDKDVYIKVISDDATTVTFQAKEASAGTYSASQVATKGAWAYVYTGTSATISLGGRAAQVEVYFPVGANNSFVDADVWVFPKRRILSVADTDYPTTRTVAETQFRFLLNGTPVYCDGGVTITENVPGASARLVAGGEQAIGTDRFGQHDVTVTINRRLVDLDLQKALMTADTVSLVAEGRNDVIVGTSTYYYGMAAVLPNLSFDDGEMHDAEDGAQNRDEVMTLRAAIPASDFTFATPGQSSITDISADIEWIVDTGIVAADIGL